ncbi:hypothetical protein F4804DRAFT_349565 [Jackrogersella minutella]|nr:hypothetical protein F4804DRAFT_349565 [Jackrogersella minutella]
MPSSDSFEVALNRILGEEESAEGSAPPDPMEIDQAGGVSSNLPSQNSRLSSPAPSTAATISPPGPRVPKVIIVGRYKSLKGRNLLPHDKVPKRLTHDTELAYIKAHRLDNENVGRVADVPCKHCAKDPEKCRIPIDPVEFNTFRCGRCIRLKIKCDFNVFNPGFQYPPEMMEREVERELEKENKKLAKMAIKEQQKEKNLAEGSGA